MFRKRYIHWSTVTSFHLNAHAVRFHLQAQKLERIYIYLDIKLTSGLDLIELPVYPASGRGYFSLNHSNSSCSGAPFFSLC